jgi:hypothetical protein
VTFGPKIAADAASETLVAQPPAILRSQAPQAATVAQLRRQYLEAIADLQRQLHSEGFVLLNHVLTPAASRVVAPFEGGGASGAPSQASSRPISSSTPRPPSNAPPKHVLEILKKRYAELKNELPKGYFEQQSDAIDAVTSKVAPKSKAAALENSRVTFGPKIAADAASETLVAQPPAILRSQAPQAATVAQLRRQYFEAIADLQRQLHSCGDREAPKAAIVPGKSATACTPSPSQEPDNMEVEALHPPVPPLGTRLDLTPGGAFAIDCPAEDPHDGVAEDPASWVTEAADRFRREGFVLLNHVLTPAASHELLSTCKEVEDEMLRYDPHGVGCRDQGRYSFGAASRSGQMLHHAAWRHLLDCAPVLDALEAILPSGFRFCGGGGDFVLGGTRHYQALHSDIGHRRVPAELQAEHPPPKLAVNFAVQDITSADFGPIRIVPRCRTLTASSEQPPCCIDEQDAQRESKLFPMLEGSALIRDLRVWHGGTPNVLAETRFLPNVELVSAGYAEFLDAGHSFNPNRQCSACSSGGCVLPGKERDRTLDPEIYKQLTPRCQRLCVSIVAESGSKSPPLLHALNAMPPRGT